MIVKPIQPMLSLWRDRDDRRQIQHIASLQHLVETVLTHRSGVMVHSETVTRIVGLNQAFQEIVGSLQNGPEEQ